LSSEEVLTKIDKYKNSFIKDRKSMNCSINTISTYSYILDRFNEYIIELDDINSLNNIDKDVILYFLDKEDKFSINTKILQLAVLKSFFKFIDELEQLNNLFEIRFKKLTIKSEHKEVEALSEDEQRRLLALFDKKSNSFNKTRDSLLIKLLLFTGIRATECLNIKLESISLIENESVYKIKIDGKGSKQRFVYISVDKINYELNCMREYTRDYIAITNRSKRMSRVGLYNVISNKMKKALINKSGVHILRHSFARNLVSKNINLKTVSELLGHKDIVLTAKTYARSNENSKIQAILV